VFVLVLNRIKSVERNSQQHDLAETNSSYILFFSHSVELF